MITRHRQSGMSIFGIMAILLMLGFFAMCIIRMTPFYFEYLSVRDVIERVVVDPETKGASSGQIRRKLGSIFNTNQIKGIGYQEVKIFDRSGKRYVDARYEIRLPIMWRIDAVLKFDDLLYEVGDIRPISESAIPKKR